MTSEIRTRYRSLVCLLVVYPLNKDRLLLWFTDISIFRYQYRLISVVSILMSFSCALQMLRHVEGGVTKAFGSIDIYDNSERDGAARPRQAEP
jgi:hypothetical protein